MREIKDNDIVIRRWTDDDCSIWIVGDNLERYHLKFKNGTNSMEMLRALNTQLFADQYQRTKVREKCFKDLRAEVKKRAGIKKWQFWRKAPQHLRDRMNDLVPKVAAEMPKDSTYEQITKEIIKQYNQCDDVGRLGHECSQHCHG